VVPSLAGFARQRGIAPQGLALGLAAYLQWARSHPPGDDADLPLIERHWRTVEPNALQELARTALSDTDLWGANLAELPGLLEATTRWLVLLQRDGVDAALAALPGMPEHAATGRTGS
jgi:mannitol-1-phosphate/altronate dehydrogenase